MASTTPRSPNAILSDIAAQLNAITGNAALAGEWVACKDPRDANKWSVSIVDPRNGTQQINRNPISEWAPDEFLAFKQALNERNKFDRILDPNVADDKKPFQLNPQTNRQTNNLRPWFHTFKGPKEAEDFLEWLTRNQQPIRQELLQRLGQNPGQNNNSVPSTITLTPGNQQQQQNNPPPPPPPSGSPYQFTPEELAALKKFRDRFVSEPQNPNPHNPLVETWVNPNDINYGVEYWDKQTNSFAFWVEPAAAPNGGIHLAPQIGDRDLTLAVLHAVKMYGNFDVNNADKAFHDKVLQIVDNLHSSGLLLDSSGQQVAQKPVVRHITGPGAGPARPGPQSAGPQPQPATAGATP